MVRWNHVTGPLSRVESTLRKKVATYHQHYSAIYIGATYDPITREQQHLSSRRGSELITLWRTASYDNAKQAEKKLIKWGCERIENPWGGGEGLTRGKGEYYIYVLV